MISKLKTNDTWKDKKEIDSTNMPVDLLVNQIGSIVNIKEEELW